MYCKEQQSKLTPKTKAHAQGSSWGYASQDCLEMRNVGSSTEGLPPGVEAIPGPRTQRQVPPLLTHAAMELIALQAVIANCSSSCCKSLATAWSRTYSVDIYYLTLCWPLRHHVVLLPCGIASPRSTRWCTSQSTILPATKLQMHMTCSSEGQTV